jgi:hypothetical protein
MLHTELHLCWGGVSSLSNFWISESNIYSCVISPTLVVTTVITQTSTVSESSTGKTTQTTTIVSTLTSTTTSSTTSSTTPSSASSTLASSTTTVAGSPPVRQTSDPSTSTQLTGSTQTSCPVGFYGCSATHAGGCCQTGRNCDTTNWSVPFFPDWLFLQAVWSSIALKNMSQF